MEDKSEKGPKTLFFVEPKSTEAAERIGVYLAEHGLTDNWREDVEDTDGGLHNGWDRLNLATARLIRSMQRQDSRVLVGYWVHEDTSGSRLKSANFIIIVAPRLQVRRTKKYKVVKGAIPRQASV